MEWVAASPGLGLSVGGCTQRESKSPDTESFTWFISNRPNSNIGSAPQVGCGEQVWPKTFSKPCLSSKSNYRQTNCTLAVPSIHEILLGHLLGPAGPHSPWGQLQRSGASQALLQPCMAGILYLASAKGIMEPWEENTEGEGLVGQTPTVVPIPRAQSCTLH